MEEFDLKVVLLDGSEYTFSLEMFDLIEYERKFKKPSSRLEEGYLEELLFIAYTHLKRKEKITQDFEGFAQEVKTVTGNEANLGKEQEAE